MLHPVNAKMILHFECCLSHKTFLIEIWKYETTTYTYASVITAYSAYTHCVLYIVFHKMGGNCWLHEGAFSFDFSACCVVLECFSGSESPFLPVSHSVPFKVKLGTQYVLCYVPLITHSLLSFFPMYVHSFSFPWEQNWLLLLLQIRF